MSHWGVYVLSAPRVQPVKPPWCACCQPALSSSRRREKRSRTSPLASCWTSWWPTAPIRSVGKSQCLFVDRFYIALAVLLSRAGSRRSHVVLHEWLAFWLSALSRFVNVVYLAWMCALTRFVMFWHCCLFGLNVWFVILSPLFIWLDCQCCPVLSLFFIWLECLLCHVLSLVYLAWLSVRFCHCFCLFGLTVCFVRFCHDIICPISFNLILQQENNLRSASDTRTFVTPHVKHRNIWWKIIFLRWPICLERFASNSPPLWFCLLC